MTDLLKGVPSWFMVMLVVVLGGYFLFSVRQLFASLMETIKELKDLIKELFDDRNDHEKRITAIESKCEERHKHN